MLRDYLYILQVKNAKNFPNEIMIEKQVNLHEMDNPCKTVVWLIFPGVTTP